MLGDWVARTSFRRKGHEGTDYFGRNEVRQNWSCCCYSERKFLPKCSQTHQKRKQREISDFSAKNTSIENDLIPQNRLSMSSLIIRPNSHYKTHFLRGLTGSYNERGL